MHCLIFSTVFFFLNIISSVQFSSVTQSCPTLWDPMNRSTRGQLPEFTQIHVHRVGDAIQQFHPLSSPSPPTPNPSQHQSLFQWVNSLHEVAIHIVKNYSSTISSYKPFLYVELYSKIFYSLKKNKSQKQKTLIFINKTKIQKWKITICFQVLLKVSP